MAHLATNGAAFGKRRAHLSFSFALFSPLARSPRRSECVIYAVRGPIIGRDDFAAVQFMTGVIATGRNSGCKR
jgi:hypothetical protein